MGGKGNLSRLVRVSKFHVCASMSMCMNGLEMQVYILILEIAAKAWSLLGTYHIPEIVLLVLIFYFNKELFITSTLRGEKCQ